MTKREEAMQWWNSLSSLYKIQICDTKGLRIGVVANTNVKLKN